MAVPPGRVKYLINYTGNSTGPQPTISTARRSRSDPLPRRRGERHPGRSASLQSMFLAARWAWRDACLRSPGCQRRYRRGMRQTQHRPGRDIIVDPFSSHGTRATRSGRWEPISSFQPATIVPSVSPTRSHITGRSNRCSRVRDYNPRKGGVDVSFKLMYDFNTVNKANQLPLRQRLPRTSACHATSARCRLVSGLLFTRRQTNADKVSGVRVNGDGYRGESDSRLGRSFATRPARFRSCCTISTNSWRRTSHRGYLVAEDGFRL